MQLLNPRYNLFSRDYWFGQVDTRPFSVFRIVFGLILLKDALFHTQIAHWFYSDAGIVPRSALADLMRTYRFSLMDAMPFTWMAQIFFLLWSAVLVCFVIGYRTRLMTVLNFIMLASVHERDIYVLNGADTVMRVLCFWLMFIPLGQYYSLDVMGKRFKTYLRTRDLADLRADDEPRTAYALPIRMIQIQFAMIYLFTSILKLPGFAWRDGTAIFYALQIRSLTLPTGDMLVQAPLWITRVMTYQSLITELIFFWFVFIPILQPAFRMTALVLGAMLHLGIAATMSIGNFSYVMIAGYLMFFEPEWITWIGAKLRRAVGQVFLPIPGNASPLWLLLATTTPSQIGIEPDHMIASANGDDWWVQGINGEGNPHVYRGLNAWQQALGHLPLSRLYGWLFSIPAIRAVVWRVVGGLMRRADPPRPEAVTPVVPSEPATGSPLLPQGARIVFAILIGLITGGVALWLIYDSRGKPISDWSQLNTLWALVFTLIPALAAGWGASAIFGWLSPVGRLRGLTAVARMVVSAFLILLMGGIWWWNLTTIDRAEGEEPLIDSVPEKARRTIQQLSLWQAWDMFSPYPSTLDGWVVIPGKFEDGTSYDLHTGRPVSTEFRRWYFGPSVRWKKYESNISRDEHEDLLRSWGSYWCDYYNDQLELPRGQRLATLEIHFYSYRSHAPGEPPNPMNDITLWRHWCYPEYEY